MPTPAHNRITFSGIFGQVNAPAEIWSVRLTTGPLVFSSDADRQAYVGRCRTRWGARMAPVLSTQVKLTRTRVSQHAEGGKTTLSAEGGYHQADDLTQVDGGRAASTVMPLQTALVATLTTGRAGATGKGRIFLPVIDRAPQLGSYRLQEVVCTEIRDAVANLVRDINGDVISPGVQDGDVVVASSKGYLSRVTGVRVGDVLDTMRSRRNALPEQYFSVAL